MIISYLIINIDLCKDETICMTVQKTTNYLGQYLRYITITEDIGDVNKQIQNVIITFTINLIK